LPSVFISPLSGTLIDRHNKVVILFSADFIRMITLGIFAYMAYIDQLNSIILLVGTIVISMASAFFNPASMAILPQLVKKEDITVANATGQISASLSSIIGPLFGSTLIVFLGVVHAFLVASLLFFFSVLFLVGIKDKNHKPENIENTVLEDLKSGFKLVQKYEIVSKMLSKMAVVNFFFSSLVIVAPLLAKGEASYISYFMSALGIGMLLSSLIFSSVKLQFQATYFLLFCLSVMGISFISLGFFENLYFILLFMFIIGVVLNGFNIILISIYQKKLPQKSQGKIMALVTAISISLQPISYGVMGVFIEWFDLHNVLYISGVFIIISALGILKVKKLNQN
jgi:predicted MFS family arabinose efflux permease